eukprot:6174146-Pleurochrysis_carterae.AAC.1
MCAPLPPPFRTGATSSETAPELRPLPPLLDAAVLARLAHCAHARAALCRRCRSLVTLLRRRRCACARAGTCSTSHSTRATRGSTSPRCGTSLKSPTRRLLRACAALPQAPRPHSACFYARSPCIRIRRAHSQCEGRCGCCFADAHVLVGVYDCLQPVRLRPGDHAGVTKRRARALRIPGSACASATPSCPHATLSGPAARLSCVCHTTVPKCEDLLLSIPPAHLRYYSHHHQQSQGAARLCSAHPTRPLELATPPRLDPLRS